MKNNRNDKQMYSAICDECGNSCQLPFQPTEGKPVYCSNCFRNKKDNGNDRYSKKPFDRRNFCDRHDRSRQLYKVTCDECGKECQVPFRPTAGKPIYCDDCFGKKKGMKSNYSTNEITEKYKKMENQMNLMHTKLDQILNFLQPVDEKKIISEEPKKKEDKKVKKSQKNPEKTSSKKKKNNDKD
jgi:CxxC-x17-CxxC domain-containing protein